MAFINKIQQNNVRFVQKKVGNWETQSWQFGGRKLEAKMDSDGRCWNRPFLEALGAHIHDRSHHYRMLKPFVMILQRPVEMTHLDWSSSTLEWYNTQEFQHFPGRKVAHTHTPHAIENVEGDWQVTPTFGFGRVLDLHLKTCQGWLLQHRVLVLSSETVPQLVLSLASSESSLHCKNKIHVGMSVPRQLNRGTYPTCLSSSIGWPPTVQCPKQD